MFQGVSTHHVARLVVLGTSARGCVHFGSFGRSRIILGLIANHIPRDKVHRPLRQREAPGDEGSPHFPTAGFGQPRQPGRDDRGDDRA